MTLKTTLAKVASVVVATSLVVGVASFGATANAAAMTAAQVQSIISLLQSFGADAATIANVQASLTGSAPSVPSTPSAPTSCSFTRDLTLGATGADVTALQQGLIANGYSIAAGATGYFGGQTQAAVMAWQKAAGITPAAGYFGPKSRAAFPSRQVQLLVLRLQLQLVPASRSLQVLQLRTLSLLTEQPAFRSQTLTSLQVLTAMSSSTLSRCSALASVRMQHSLA